MEDRTLPVLHLETYEQGDEETVQRRADELGSDAHVERVSWWRNAAFGRDDLPRELPEFSTLLCCEAADGFAASAPPAGATTHPFRRTRRPGQGVLTGGETTGLSLVLISPKRPDEAQVLRDWGDFVHIRHIAEVGVPGYAMITPYERSGPGDPLFCHLYEIDTSGLDHDDPEVVFQSMTPLVTERIGPRGSAAWNHWAVHPALRIMYVNTFCKQGGLPA